MRGGRRDEHDRDEESAPQRHGVAFHSANLNLLRPSVRLFGRGQRDFEHTILEGRFALLVAHAFGYRKRTIELSVMAFAPIVPVAIFLVLLATLARDGQHAV